MGVKNFVSYEDARQLMTQIGAKFDEVEGAYVFRGAVTFANLPSALTEAMTGYVYDVTDAFTTDARFKEGAGVDYPAGSNVAVADLSTYAAVTPVGSENPSNEGWYELDSVTGKYVLSTDTTVDNQKTYYAKTVTVKFDVLGGFIDVNDIYEQISKLQNDLADEFNKTTGGTQGDGSYAIGDIVVYENGLYKFKAAHTANTDWDATEVDAITIESLISAAEPDSLTTAQINALIGLID